MTAYSKVCCALLSPGKHGDWNYLSKPGCHDTYRIDRIFEKEGLHDKNGKAVPKGNCIPVDYKYTGTPGVDQSNQGRLMSIKFDGM